MLEYKKIRKYDSDVFVLKFPKDKYRIDLSYGDYGNFDNFEKLERVSDIYGEPGLDELVAGRINFGFFQPKKEGQNISEHIGGAWDGDVGYRNYVSDNDFPDVIYTFDGQLIFDDIRTAEQAANYDSISAWNGAVSYILLKDGEVYNEVPKSMTGIYNNLNPRTLAGQDAEGAFYFVAVDGRTNESKGFTGLHSASFMKELGCVGAFNGDGGGSTVILLYDDILNKPSDGAERYVGTILLAYEKYDPKDLPLIKMGNKGVFTHLLQRLLGQINNNYSGIDADFGAKTSEKVKAFQTKYGLTADGIVGAKTWDALYRVAVKGETITPHSLPSEPEPEPHKEEFLLFADQTKFKDWLFKQSVNRKITRIQQHNTAVPAYKDWEKSQDEQSYMRGFKYWSTVDMGWRDTAQHFTVFPNGKIGIGRTLEYDPAGIAGANTGSICIEHFGYFDTGIDIMTEEQKDASLFLNACLCIKFNITPNTDTIIYHHWFDLNTGERKNGEGITKTCPGTNFFGGNKVEDAEKNFIPKVKEYISTITGNPISEPSPTPLLEVTKINKTVKTTASELNVRNLPSAQGKVLGVYNNAEIVDIYGEVNGWYQVIFNNSIGYVSAKYTEDVLVDTTDYQTLYTTLKTEYKLLQAEYDQLQDDYDLLLLDKPVEDTEEVKNKFVALLEALLNLFKK